MFFLCKIGTRAYGIYNTEVANKNMMICLGMVSFYLAIATKLKVNFHFG